MITKYIKNQEEAKKFRSDIQAGSISPIKSFLQENKKDMTIGKISSAIDMACANAVYRAEFETELSKRFGKKVEIKAYTDEDRQQMANYTIAGSTGTGLSNITDIQETSVLTDLNNLIFEADPILSRVRKVKQQNNQANLNLAYFNTARTAETLTETSAGTTTDSRPIAGDNLLPNLKIQTSASFSEYALSTLDPATIVAIYAEMFESIGAEMVKNILLGDNVNKYKGIINSFGTTANTQEGALEYVAEAGVSDNLDQLLYMEGDLPASTTLAQQQRMVWIMDRSTWYKSVRVVKNTTQDYKLQSALSGGEMTLFGKPVLLCGGVLNSKRVILADLNNYIVATLAEPFILSDEGLVSIKEGITNVVVRTWTDGGMIKARKNSGDTADLNNNKDGNFFRYTLLS